MNHPVCKDKCGSVACLWNRLMPKRCNYDKYCFNFVKNEGYHNGINFGVFYITYSKTKLESILHNRLNNAKELLWQFK